MSRLGMRIALTSNENNTLIKLTFTILQNKRGRRKMIVEGKTENMLTKLAQIQMISVDFMTSS